MKQSQIAYQCNFCQVMPYILCLIRHLLQLPQNWSKLEGPVSFIRDTEVYLHEGIYIVDRIWQRHYSLWEKRISLLFFYSCLKSQLNKAWKANLFGWKRVFCNIFICRKAEDFKAICRSRKTSDYCCVKFILNLIKHHTSRAVFKCCINMLCFWC